MIKKLLTLMISMDILLLWGNILDKDNVRFKALVVDEVSGEPVPGCVIRGNFTKRVPKKSLDSWYETTYKEYITDKTGVCELSGYTNIGKAGFSMKSAPQGYYPGKGGLGHRFKIKDVFGNWQPDDLCATIRVQRVEHPIPLFVKHVDRHNNKKGIAPYDGKNSVMKFDLVKGDWLPPIGQGEVADIEFRMTCEITGKEFRWNYESVFFELNTDIVFPNEGDGIKEVRLENPKYLKIREASQVEYVNNMRFNYAIRKVVSRPQFPDEWGARTFSDHDDNRSYVFRIRSKFNEKGELIEAYYGKIYNDFVISGFPKVGPCGMNFLYYLNLNSLDRNLEWDMKTNLCNDPGSVQEAP